MIEKHSVMLGVIHPGVVTHGYHVSVLNLVTRELTTEGARRVRGTLSARCLYLAEGRNEVVWGFMKKAQDAEAHGAPPIDWLLFLDSDIVFDADLLDAFAGVADAETAPIVSGLYFSPIREMSVDGAPLVLPVWLERRNGKREFVLDPLDGPEMRPLTSCGMGVCLIHRRVFTDMLEAHKADGWPWFGHDLDDDGKKHMGEDVTFCERALALNYPIYGAKAIQVRHIKSREVDSSTFVQPSEVAAEDLVTV